MKGMWQVLCYTGKAFDTCFRPGKCSDPTQHVLGHAVGRCTQAGMEQVQYTPVRWVSA